MDDAACLRAVEQGDERALSTLHERHASWIYLRLLRRCGDRDQADQATQDAFIAVWRSAGSYRGEGEVTAWMWGIAIRRLIDLQRRLKPLPSLAVRDEPSAEDEVLTDLAYGQLGPVLETLTPELVDVVRATVIDGLTAREAGQLLGIPEGTVRTRLMRARQQLRERVT
jgi:RNA polymerase sigma-70 factor (ECF subfamily)